MSTSGEITRLRYLAAMGVPVYVTRRALPGAAVTAKCALRVASARPEVRPPAAQALRESLRGDTRPQAAPAPLVGASAGSASPAGASAAAHGSEPATRFRLVAVICGGRLWLESLGEEALATEQLQLISAMGRALTHPDASDDAPALTEFRWPLHDNLQLGLGASEAAATLQGFLYRQLEDNACVELICLGESSKTLLTDLKLPCARRFVPSTLELLKNPAMKRDIWTALRA